MQTLANLITTHGVDVDDHLDRDELVPTLTALQFQGDVAVIPVGGTVTATGSGYPKPIPADGVAVVRGENGGNTHLLLAGGPDVTWDTSTGGPTGLDLGVLTVPAGQVAYFAHPEHGYLGIGPGQYIARRQREQADVIRLVAD